VRTIIGAAVVAVLTITTVACGSDDDASTKQEQFCDDASSFESAVSQLVDDVKAGNFGDAKDQLSKVESRFSSLQSSAKHPASDTRSTVEGQLDDLKSTLQGLTSVGSLGDIESTLNEAGSQLQDALSSITDALSC
jgi:uncharacterized phage infection (PIP) family protein YhgE